MPARIAEGTDVVHIWDRQEKESNRAYSAFLVYLGVDGKPPIRALPKVAEVFQCSRQNIQRWHHQYNWDKRASAHDAYIRQKEDDARELAARASVKRVAEAWADHRIAFLERYMKSHLAMLSKVEDMLVYPIHEITEETEWYEDGRARKVTVVNPAGWRARDMSLISKHLIESLRDVMDMMEGPATAARSAADEDMDPDEASAAIRAILDARARKAGVPGPEGA